MPAETPTQLLHRLTSYSPGREWDQPDPDQRIVHTFEANDLSRRPLAFEHYDGPRRRLPRRRPTSSRPGLAVLAGHRENGGQAVGAAGIGRLLYLAAGVTRTALAPSGYRHLLRGAGSAGARFPLELYLAMPHERPGLPAGVHWYDPAEHALVQIGPPPPGQAPTVVVTGVPWRTGWRYRERGFRHLYWDAGSMLAQLLAAADSTGPAGRLHTAFPDRTAAELVGADGVQEFPLAVVGLGDGLPVVGPGGPAQPGRFEPDAIDFPLVTAAQRAGEESVLLPPWDFGPAVPPARTSPETVDELIRRRGSIRRFDPAAELPRATLEAAMTAALRGIAVPHWVAVHAVTGLPAGLYRWPDLDRPVRTGNLRADCYRAGLAQALARDASFVVIAAAPWADLDEHGYREAQLAAGLVDGRLHLLAAALGAGATGMTFQDSDLPALLGEPGLAGLLWTCVGVPEYASGSAGTPGAPREVRMVAGRG